MSINKKDPVDRVVTDVDRCRKMSIDVNRRR